LGELLHKPQHGYGVAARLRHRLPSAGISPADLYPILNRLHHAGLLTKTVLPGESRATYTVTEKGVEEYERWVRSSSTTIAPIRSELLVKLAVARLDNREDLIALLAQCDEAQGELLRQLHDAAVDEDDEDDDLDPSTHGIAVAFARAFDDAQREHALAHWQADLVLLERMRARLRRLLEALPS